ETPWHSSGSTSPASPRRNRPTKSTNGPKSTRRSANRPCWCSSRRKRGPEIVFEPRNKETASGAASSRTGSKSTAAATPPAPAAPPPPAPKRSPASDRPNVAASAAQDEIAPIELGEVAEYALQGP